MGFIYRYLRAVLWGDKDEPKTEKKQKFIDNLRAWKEKEKKHRQDLAYRLLGEIREKFEKYKTALKENNNLKKEKCEQKEKWGKIWCRFTAFIAYWRKLTAAYVIHLLKLTPRRIVYNLTVAIAWLLILVYWVAKGIIKAIVWISILVYWVAKGIIKAIIWLLIRAFFLVHYALRIAFGPLLLAVFAVVFFCIALYVFDRYGMLIENIASIRYIGSIGSIGSIMDHKPDVVVATLSFVINGFAINYLSQFMTPSFQTVQNYIKQIVKNFKDSLSPPAIKIIKGLKETKKILRRTINDMIGLGGLLVLLLATVLLSAMISSAGKVMENTNIFNNYVYMNFEPNVESSTKNPLVNKDDKPPSVITAVSFPYEARANDWVNGKYGKDCLYSQASQNDPGSCAVKPDKELAKAGFRALLKWLSAYESSEQKVELKIVGFSSSSGLLSLKDDKDFREKVENKVKEGGKEGGKESCYERTNSNQVNGYDNLRLSNAFNLCMAELRAWNVAKMLKEIIVSDKTIPADRINVISHEWGSYSEMCQHRRFCDTKKEGGTECYDTDLGLENRRTDVWFKKIIECTNSLSANGIHACEAEAQIPPEPQGETCDQCTSPVPVPCDRL